MKKLALLMTIAVFGSGVFAHSKVNMTLPADNAMLAQAPETLTLRFASKIRLTKVDIAHGDQPAADLDLGDQKSFATEFVIPMTGMGSGRYAVEWRGLGIDGHAMTGAFVFTVE